MRILFVGDSLTEGVPGVSYVKCYQDNNPDDEVVNLGRRNDTVYSLLERLKRKEISGKFDIIVIWIGVNDIICRTNWTYWLARTLVDRPVTPDPGQFEATYNELITYLRPYTERFILLTPMLKSENVDTSCNKKLDQLVTPIITIANQHQDITLLDVRRMFKHYLINKEVSDFFTQNAFQSIWDAIIFISPAQIDWLAKRRGLHLTFDGLHLNTQGAMQVAQIIKSIIHPSLHP